jgi:HD superfamily phosphohydrolase
MKTTLRGRPRLDIPLERIIEEVKTHGQVMIAARALGYSDAYIHKRFRAVDITLSQVLDGLYMGSLCRREEDVEEQES